MHTRIDEYRRQLLVAQQTLKRGDGYLLVQQTGGQCVGQTMRRDRSAEPSALGPRLRTSAELGRSPRAEGWRRSLNLGVLSVAMQAPPDQRGIDSLPLVS